MQHPTQRLLSNDMFASLRRWMGDESPASGSGPSLRGECPQPTDEIPLDTTLAATDTAGIDVGLLSAWHGPNGLDLI